MIVKKIVRSHSRIVQYTPYAIMVVLFILSSLSQNQLPTIDFKFIDKIEHFIAFFTLSFLWFLALKTKENSFRRSLVFAVIFSVLYGLFDESHQGFFTADRTFDWYDLVADFLGAATSSVLIYFKYRKDFRN